MDRICVIGDLHGKDVWKDIMRKSDADLYIFLGDYISKDKNHQQILNNLLSIIETKKKFPNNIILLLGDHEFHCLHYDEYKTLRYSQTLRNIYKKVLYENRSLFQISFQYGKLLFTHAGVSDYWLDFFVKSRTKRKYTKAMSISEQLNIAYHTKLDRKLLVSFKKEDSGGPLVADISETYYDPIKSTWQYVGHSPVKDIKTVATYGTRFVYCDCYDTIINPHIIEFSNEQPKERV